MIPRIQHDESLHSFMHRTLYLNWNNPGVSKVKELQTYAVNARMVKRIAGILEWPGCYGFNRLLHNHTSYAVTGIFNSSYDISYSQQEYISKSQSSTTNETWYAYCPECIREDLRNLGYSYWRRSHLGGVTVCGNHNVVLVRSCPFCNATILPRHDDNLTWLARSRTQVGDSGSHNLDLMWRGCSGRLLSETNAIKNISLAALKEAKFYNALFSYGFHISIEIATPLLYEKFCALRSTNSKFSAEYLEYFEWLEVLMEEIADDLSGTGRFRFYEGEGLVKSAMAVYDTFDDFVEEVGYREKEPLPVESLWSTYASGGDDSVHYIKEDYTTGIGLWSCPSKPLGPFNRDGITVRRPFIYPCCNFAHQPRGGDRLVARKVRSPMPRIPMVNCTDLATRLHLT